MNKQKKILVTGGSGFVGIYVIKELLEKGYFVIAISRNRKVKIKHTNLIEINADICSEEMSACVALQIPDISIIIHLAADISVPGDYLTFEHNVRGTWNIIGLANLLQVDKVIYLSSVPIIGKPLNIPITEEHPIQPETPYHMSKYVGERFFSFFLNKEIKRIILRISSPIGVGMRESIFLHKILTQCKNNTPISIWGSGKRVQNYIDVRDVAKAISLSVVHNADGLYLISGEKSISNVDLAYFCKMITNSRSEILFSQRDNTEPDTVWKLSGKLAENDLQYKPEHGLEETIDWIYSAI